MSARLPSLDVNTYMKYADILGPDIPPENIEKYGQSWELLQKQNPEIWKKQGKFFRDNLHKDLVEKNIKKMEEEKRWRKKENNDTDVNDFYNTIREGLEKHQLSKTSSVIPTKVVKVKATVVPKWKSKVTGEVGKTVSVVRGIKNRQAMAERAIKEAKELFSKKLITKEQYDVITSELDPDHKWTAQKVTVKSEEEQGLPLTRHGRGGRKKSNRRRGPLRKRHRTRYKRRKRKTKHKRKKRRRKTRRKR